MKKNLFFWLIPFFLVIAGFLILFFSAQEMSLTMDELAHTPAGFSYLYKKDFRLNPEHPPLVKDLAAIPLMFLNLNFPENHDSWQTGVNNQWWFGNQFIFNSGNNADKIIFWSRIPMMLLTVFFWLFAYFWSKKILGEKYALIVLLLAVFSPTILAHGNLVTTDIGASLGFLLATYFWLEFLKKPGAKNIIFAGIVLGFSLLLKFSLILLVPMLGIITVAYFWAAEKKFKEWMKYIFQGAIVLCVALLLIIWPIYYVHTLNYPQEKQMADTQEILASGPMKFLKNATVWLAGIPPLRPLVHYGLGLLMATQRVGAGNTVYFLGNVSRTGWKHYFPAVYLLKEPLAFYILACVLLIIMAGLILKSGMFCCNGRIQKIKKWLAENIDIFSLLTIIGIYWITSILGNLNIGVRHVLPVIVPTYIFIIFLLKRIKERLSSKTAKKMLFGFVSLILAWYLGSSLFAFPHYIPYFNELGQGTKNGYKYVVDSNYDWGQDLKRLQGFVEKNNIEKIKVDYFGGDDVGYRLGEKWEKFDPQSGPQSGWIAVSGTLLQGGRGTPTKDFNQPAGYYSWLNNYQIISRAGYSIFIYKID